MRSILQTKNKRADFQSIIIMIVIVFALAVGSVIFSKIFLEITDELKNQDEFSNRTIETIETVEENTIPLLDFLIFFSLISLMIGLIISSIYIDVHPAIIIVFILALIIAIFLGGQIANIYNDIVTEPQLISTSSQFDYSNIVLGVHFPIIILVTGVIVVIVLYGKSRRVGEV